MLEKSILLAHPFQVHARKQVIPSSNQLRFKLEPYRIFSCHSIHFFRYGFPIQESFDPIYCILLLSCKRGISVRDIPSHESFQSFDPHVFFSIFDKEGMSK